MNILRNLGQGAKLLGIMVIGIIIWLLAGPALLGVATAVLGVQLPMEAVAIGSIVLALIVMGWLA